jgi:hypothetical protein
VSAASFYRAQREVIAAGRLKVAEAIQDLEPVGAGFHAEPKGEVWQRVFDALNRAQADLGVLHSLTVDEEYDEWKQR